MEIKGNSDHSKLIEMLDVLNDESSSMDEEVFARYFDPENIAYWLAFQLLTGNTDTQSRNVYLYSPQNSDCWYLLDWDNDGMLRRKEREIIQFSDSESWEAGREQLLGQCVVPPLPPDRELPPAAGHRHGRALCLHEPGSH